MKQTSVDSNDSTHKQGGIRMTKSTHKVHVVDGKKPKNQSMLSSKAPPLQIQGSVNHTVESNDDVKSGRDNQIQVEVSDTHSSGLNSLVQSGYNSINKTRALGERRKKASEPGSEFKKIIESG